VTKQEFYEAGRNGLNPQFMAQIFAAEYNGEELVEYQGRTYSIYRTYHVPGTDYMELYIERKGGSNGKQESEP
jgi:SPP1 family predicted phage head-tail adaptor